MSLSPSKSPGIVAALASVVSERLQGATTSQLLGIDRDVRNGERYRRASDRQIGLLRLVAVAACAGVYLLMLEQGRSGTPLAYTVLAGVATYALGVVVLHRHWEGMPRWVADATVLLDGGFIAAWIYATGGLSSLFHPLWYASIVAVAYRSGLLQVGAASLFYTALLGLVGGLTGELPGAFAALAVHSTFIPLTGGLTALLAVAYEEERTTRLEAHARSQAERLEASESERAQIARVEEKWRSILENAPETVMMIDPEGRLEYTNLVDTSEEQALVRGVPATDWLPDRAHDRFHEALEAVIEEGRTVSFEIESRRPGGAPAWYLTRMGPITKDGEIVAASMVSTDISDRRVAEHALETYARELERSHETVAQYARLAAHDLQAPIRDVTHYAELLEQHVGDELPSELHDYTGYAIEGAKRIHELVEALREFSEMDTRSIKPREIEGDELVDRVLTRLAADLEATDAEITVEPLPTVTADPGHLERAVHELVDNALSYAGDAPTVTIGGDRTGDEVTLWVEDDGPGIPAEYRDRVMEPFRRLHTWDEVPGAGVGLAFVQRVADRHGGGVQVEAREDGGTRVELTLSESIDTVQTVPDAEALLDASRSSPPDGAMA